MDENAVRAGWKTGAPCQIYSNSKKKWFTGEVAQIFTDEEGEWLEVRYDKSMSKQVQRYSSDIRPHPEDLKKKKKKTATPDSNVPFPDHEMKLRQSLDKGDEVEIFSNTHQEWYLGEIVDIIKDEEGEWLNCVWNRANGEAMSKQVQRFSTDVRPVHDDASTGSSSSDGGAVQNTSKKPRSQKDRTVAAAAKIAQRKKHFKRKAPPFSQTLRPSTFTYPATSSARRSRKLLDLEETNEKNQHVIDRIASPKQKSKSAQRRDLSSLKPQEVREFIRSLGSVYEKYATKFKVRGSQFVNLSEGALQKLVSNKLHRHRILLEIARHSPSNDADVFDTDIEPLHWDSLRVRQWCSESPVLKLYADKFRNHGVDGMLLFELDSKDLSTIGVKKSHQQRALDIIAKFANDTFPADNDDEKSEEPGKLNGSGHRKRGSVAHIDVAALMNGDSDALGGIVGAGRRNNDAIIFTMGQLLLELGQMFKVGKVQDLTTILKAQLEDLQSNSNHPQMTRNRPSANNITIPDAGAFGGGGGGDEGDDESANGKVDRAMMKKMGDRVDSSPTGVDAAWLNTQSGVSGHRRRASIGLNQMANTLDDDDDSEDNSEVSDIE